MSERVSYAEAGEALRGALRRAQAAALTAREWRVLGAYVELVASYSRTSDRVARRQLVELTGLDERHVRRAVKRLGHLGVIEHTPGNGRGHASLVRFRPEKGGLLPAPVLEQRGAAAGPPSRRERGADPDAKGGPGESPIREVVREEHTHATLDAALSAKDETHLRAAARGLSQQGASGMTFKNDEWLAALRRLADRFSADEIARVCAWLTVGDDPIASRWQPRINGPADLAEHWVEMRREYLASRGRRVVAPAPEPKPSTNGDDPGFVRFWELYPRRVGKGAARKAWAKAVKTTEPDAILDGVRRYVAAGLPESRFIPYPSTWLNGEHWTDEFAPEATGEAWPRQSMGRHAL